MDLARTPLTNGRSVGVSVANILTVIVAYDAVRSRTSDLDYVATCVDAAVANWAWPLCILSHALTNRLIPRGQATRSKGTTSATSTGSTPRAWRFYWAGSPWFFASSSTSASCPREHSYAGGLTDGAWLLARASDLAVDDVDEMKGLEPPRLARGALALRARELAAALPAPPACSFR